MFDLACALQYQPQVQVCLPQGFGLDDYYLDLRLGGTTSTEDIINSPTKCLRKQNVLYIITNMEVMEACSPRF